MATTDQEARNKWSPAVRTKMQELADLVSREQYGEQGVPLEVTWTEIEDIGHEIGQLAAAEVDQTLQRSHAEHFDDPQACPACGRKCKTSVEPRALKTRDGTADLSEPTCFCNACERSFFPSAGCS